MVARPVPIRRVALPFAALALLVVPAHAGWDQAPSLSTLARSSERVVRAVVTSTTTALDERFGVIVILRARAAWTVNPNEAEELIQLTDPLGQVTGVPPPPPERLTAVANPNPFADRTTILFVQPAPGTLTATVFEVVGSRVRRLAHDSWAPAGRNAIDWNGRDDRGARVPPGVYFVRIRGAAQEARVRIVRMD